MSIMSNRKTPNFAYGNFSFQEKGFNMGYTAHFVRPKNCYAIPSHIPNIRQNYFPPKSAEIGDK